VELLGAALVLAWFALLAIWIAAIVSANRFRSAAFEAIGRSRGGTITLVVLSGWIGAIYYFLTIRRQLRTGEV